MPNFRFTIVKTYRFNIFRFDTTLYRIGTQQILIPGSFTKGHSFLTACYILYPGPYLQNKGNQQT